MQKESGLQGRIGMEGDGRITMNQGEVVTFETVLKSAKSGRRIKATINGMLEDMGKEKAVSVEEVET